MKKVHKLAFTAALALALFCAEASAQQKGTFTDPRDKKVYKTVKIGEQTWMAENLDYAGAKDDIGACYDKKPANCKKYGALYSLDEVMKMKICPEGWHLPSDEEWQALVDFAGGNDIAGKKLKAKSGWKAWKCKYEEKTESVSGRGNVTVTVIKHDKCNTDEFGFAALPGGDGISISGGLFFNASNIGSWWSSSESNVYGAYYYRYISYGSEYVQRNGNDESSLYSVRCLQD